MRLCKFPFVHKWERYVPKDVPTIVTVEKWASGILGTANDKLEYNTVVTRLTRYCERCGDKQIKHADVIHIHKVEVEK